MPMHLPSTTDWLRRSAERTSAAPALVAGGVTHTYADLDGRVARAVRSLVDRGIGPGDRVGVDARRTVDTVVLLWAIWRLGAVAVVLGPRPDDAAGWDDARTRWGLVDVLSRLDPADRAAGVPGEPPDGGAQHTWVPTSGSTGRPRAVVLTHGNIAAAVDASQRRLGNTAADRWLLTLPLFHVGGLSILWRSAAAGGAVVLHERFDAARTAAAFCDGEVTVASLVPTMLHRILDVAEGTFAPMRAVLLGGAPAGDDDIVRALDAGLPILTTYGLSEACSQVATVRPGRMWEALGTAGPPLDGVTVVIADPDAAGVGRITIDGPTVSPGYAGEPARVGPLRTGDLGRIDDAGRLVVIGRADGVVITGGENVVPATVERVLETHPAIRRSVVHGVADPEWGEIVAAIVETARPVATADLDAFCREHLRPAERPRRWRVVAAMPLLPNGKVDRAALIAE